MDIPSVDEAAATNPAVDRDQLAEANDLLDSLREQGLTRREYEGVSPYDDRLYKTDKH